MRKAIHFLTTICFSRAHFLIKEILWQAGAFRIGDTAGTIDNIVSCKLHRPGSVGFVSKSGGMSNEMYNVLSRVSDGLFEGTAFGSQIK